MARILTSSLSTTISSGTRWRLTGSEDIGGGNKVGFNWEWQNSSEPVEWRRAHRLTATSVRSRDHA